MDNSSKLQFGFLIIIGIATSFYIYKTFQYRKNSKKSKNSKNSSTMIKKQLSEIAKSFRLGKALTKIPPIPFVGRIQYEPYNGYLTKTCRSFAFVSGEDGIYKMSQHNSDIDKCIFVGFSKDFMKTSCNKKRKFRLLLFPENANKYGAIWCIWNNIFNLLEDKYPNDVYPRIKPFINDLKTKKYKEIIKDAKFSFCEVEENGESDSNYMSFDRFVSIPIDQVTLVDVRLFLYLFLHLNELFDGDGYTEDKNGNRGCKEYLIPNVKLDAIENLHIVPFDVTTSNV